MPKKKDLNPEQIVQAVETKKLSAAEMWKIRALSAEIQLAEMTASCNQLKKQILVMKIDPQGHLAGFDREINNNIQLANATRNDYEELKRQIADRLSLASAENLSYDEDTGEITQYE